MALQRNHIENMRDTYIDAWEAALISGTKKADIAAAWSAMSSDASSKLVMAQTDSNGPAEELLASLASESAAKSTDLTNNPNDWSDNQLELAHRHWLTLLTTLTPTNLRPHQWGKGHKPV